MENLIGIFLLATLVEGLVNYLFATQDGYSRPWLKYVALGLGVVAAIAYKVDIPAMAGLVSPMPYVSYVVSGLILGRGSNYLHDVLTSIKG